MNIMNMMDIIKEPISNHFFFYIYDQLCLILNLFNFYSCLSLICTVKYFSYHS